MQFDPPPAPLNSPRLMQMRASEDVIINLERPACGGDLRAYTPARETQDSRDDGFDSNLSHQKLDLPAKKKAGL